MSYSSYSLDEPCGYTCPSIDSVIANIDHAVSLLDTVLNHCEQPGLDADISAAIDNLSGLESDLNELRENNSELRAWGKSLADVIEKIQEVL